MSQPRRTVGLNGLFLDYPHSGMWAYTTHLTPALVALDSNLAFRLYLRRGHEVAFPRAEVVRPRWPIHTVEASPSWLRQIDKLGWEQVAWPLSARKDSLLHSLYFAAPAIPGSPLVVTIHDVVPLRAEHSHGKPATLYASLMRQTAKRARAIITVSEHAKAEITTTLQYPTNRIFVTPEAPDPAIRKVTDVEVIKRVRKRYGLPDQFVLYLGGTQRRKNIEMLVQAWGLLHPPAATLVIVGKFRGSSDSLFPDVPSLVSKLGLQGSVHFVPYVDDGDLAAVYTAATLFCYPSRYEGFGLPPLEAMACETPVLAANTTSLPEVLGNGAELLSPDDPAAWSEAIARLIDDEDARTELTARGSVQVKKYSWEKTARRTLRVYDEVIKD